MRIIQIRRANTFHLTLECFKLAGLVIDPHTHHAKTFFCQCTGLVENIYLHTRRNRNASGLDAINVSSAQSSQRENHAKVH
jgi:hypothetical protein